MNDVADLQGVSADTAWQLANGALHDPFGVLGPHDTAAGRVVRAYLPGARSVEVIARNDKGSLGTLMPMRPDGLFVGRVKSADAYRLRIEWPGAVQEVEDAYSFNRLLL
ncbi:MAG TPA: 1,4-alpha-glucan branching enzyme, partial [Acetobacteraceae bacterium]|nr:1,4-alpha-glucan branching enzyme [Acetobacteraceae bacterium]